MSDTPTYQIVAGEPTAEELAALTAVLAGVSAARARAAAASASRGTRTGRWACRPDLLRRPLTPGPGAWRHSAAPR